eukprot:5603555-Amphidinium_carterae.1
MATVELQDGYPSNCKGSYTTSSKSRCQCSRHFVKVDFEPAPDLEDIFLMVPITSLQHVDDLFMRRPD